MFLSNQDVFLYLLKMTGFVFAVISIDSGVSLCWFHLTREKLLYCPNLEHRECCKVINHVRRIECYERSDIVRFVYLVGNNLLCEFLIEPEANQEWNRDGGYEYWSKYERRVDYGSTNESHFSKYDSSDHAELLPPGFYISDGEQTYSEDEAPQLNE